MSTASKVERVEINTLTKGTAEPKLLVVNGKEYPIKVFSPDEKQDLYAYLSKLILDLRTTYHSSGSEQFKFFNPGLLGDLLVIVAVIGKRDHSDAILDLIQKGLGVEKAWFSENNVFGEHIWTIFNGILKAQGIDILDDVTPQKKNR